MNPTLTFRTIFVLLALTVVSLAAAQSTDPPFLGVDANKNQISDVYEKLYPLTGNAQADDDDDGVSNGDEAAAGTNAGSATEYLNFTEITNDGTTVSGKFPSVAGKRYQMQAQSGLGGAWVNEGNPIQGDGTVLSSSAAAAGERMFVRLAVSDQDSDGDTVNDWEEIKAGTDRYLWDTDGDGTSDRSYVESLIAASSSVNIYAVNAFAMEGGTGNFRITRSGGFLPVTVPLAVSGTATLGTDYNLSSASVTLPAGVMTATVTVTALTDATAENAETITLTVQSGAGYTVGGSAAATLTIVSQGLTGEYYNFESGTYNFDPVAGGNWDPAELGMTRRDAAIDFDWLGVAPLGSDDVWGARWMGCIVPKYSELYQVHAIADRGVKVYISAAPITAAAGQLRIDQWATTSPTTKYSNNALTGSAPFVAGRAYYIRVDYRDSATNANNANVQVRWSSASQPEETIPSERLTSENIAGVAPVITSPLFITAISGAPFSYQITASGTPTSFSATGLPGGLSVDAGGLVTGSLSGTEGYHFATISAANNAGTDAKNIVIYMATTGGGITRDVWNNLTGTGVLSVPVHTAPASTSTVTSLATAADLGDGFGDRLRGYITAPATGLYTFFVTSDENVEVWISSSEEPASRLKRSFISYGNVGSGAWNAVSSQQSLPMMMKGGRRYFVEVIRRESSGGDHLQVGWLKPGQTGTPEVVPGWALTPYTPPEAGNGEGFLYSAVLTPQSGASTLGSGSALLRVNEDKTEADLTVTWGNLTGPITNSHIHDSRSTPGPVGAIIFDIDDADPDRLLPGGDGLDPDEVYHWDIIATGNHTYADVIAALEGGTAYINLHTAAYPNGEIRGFFQPVIGSQTFVPPPADPLAGSEWTLPSDATERKKEIVRFMQQATFGAAPDRDGATDALPVNAPFGGWQADSIEAVQELGYAGWIDAQMNMDRGTDPEVLVTTLSAPTTIYQASTSGRRTPNTYTNVGNGSGPFGTFLRQYYERYPRSGAEPDGVLRESASDLWRTWWRFSCTAPDQLRHRVAFALSQILVVSEDGEFDERARWIGHYYDLLYYHGLDNFRTLLEKVTLNPAMGGYLDMLDNEKADPATGYIPNENYAREIMQLFTIGLRRLHPDGTLVLDSGGLPVPTYQQDNVVGLASTLTGWRLAAGPGNWILPMPVTASRHDFTDKLLLEEAYIPASAAQTNAQCDLELDQSHDLLFQHPNTGPFICRQLIQRMVTANPSPGYIYRVAKIFADNGSGVRGDMKSVVKAILLDSEARHSGPGSARAQVGYGHLKEPVMRATQFIRAFRGYSLAESKPEWANANDLGLAIFSPITNVDLTQPLPQRTNRWPDSINRTLSTAIAATPATGSVTLTLSSAPSTPVAVGEYLRVGSEDFVITSINTTSSFIADRAQLGSTAAVHNTGATVSRLTPFNDSYIDEMIDPDGTGPLGLTPFSLIVQQGNVILLRRQTTGSAGSTSNGETLSPENGLYVVAADGANPGRLKLARAANADTGPEVTKGFVIVATTRRDDGTLSGNRTFYQERPVTNVGTDVQYWVYQGQTNTAKGPAQFSPATNINVSGFWTSTGSTTRTATLTENIGGTNYNFTIQTNNILLLRRQTANAGYINPVGDTSSPENGLYTVTNDPNNANRVILVRNSGMNTPGEFVNASCLAIQTRLDDGSLYPSVAFTSAETPSRVYRQELAVTTLGSDPVRWSQQAAGAGINVREAWGIGGTGSTTFSQTPLKSPTVFNFYEPDYVFLGYTGNSGLYGPEFQITSETSVVNTANWFVDLTRRNSTNATTQASPFSYGQGFSYGDPFKRDVKLDLTYERSIAGNTAALLDHLSIMLMPNQMSPRLRTLLQTFLDTYATGASDAEKMNRLGEVLYLISLSPEFANQP
ncbi:MAG TPA: DUF1800 family protein [Verrucomicrobiales bacterium]|nr:DUF1800 family protein [Verrucomicrobiales bacterium]